MRETIRNIFKIPDLRRKIIFTFLIVLVHRIGCHIPCPFIDPKQLADFWSRQMGTGGKGVLGMIDMFSGRAFRNMTVFALGIMPYISASIILQLLMVVWPRLEKIAKEGEAGKKKINQYTRYGTVLLSGIQSFGLAFVMIKMRITAIPDQWPLFVFMTVLSMTTGSTLLMWLGEKISENGIGNGISIIIAAGIMASYPLDISVLLGTTVGANAQHSPIWIPIVLATFIVVSIAIIYMQEGSRKIPIQHAKRVVGRRVVSGQTTFLPLKVNTAGVIPVIFSGAILSFPGIIFSWAGSQGGGIGFFAGLKEFFAMASIYNVYNLFNFSRGGLLNLFKIINAYTLIEAILTGFFCYFYTAITFNPVDTAENLKKYGAFIPGRRPGKSTSDYIDFVLTRITIVGAMFLIFVTLLPRIFSVAFNLNWQISDLIGGTGLIIVVGVLLETMKQIESHLLMRHYEGFKYRKRGYKS